MGTDHGTLRWAWGWGFEWAWIGGQEDWKVVEVEGVLVEVLMEVEVREGCEKRAARSEGRCTPSPSHDETPGHAEHEGGARLGVPDMPGGAAGVGCQGGVGVSRLGADGVACHARSCKETLRQRHSAKLAHLSTPNKVCHTSASNIGPSGEP